MQFLNKWVFFSSRLAPGAEPDASFAASCYLSKNIKFAASIFQMKDPLQAKSGLVIIPPINSCCEFTFMGPAWTPWRICLSEYFYLKVDRSQFKKYVNYSPPFMCPAISLLSKVKMFSE